MDKLNISQIGLRLRKQRELMKMTRENLADKLNITVKFLSDIELGQKGMSIQTLANFSKVLDLSVDYILFGESCNDQFIPTEEKIFLSTNTENENIDKISFIANYIAQNFTTKK